MLGKKKQEEIIDRLVLIEKTQDTIANILKTIVVMLTEKDEKKEEKQEVNPLYLNQYGELDYQFYKKNRIGIAKGEIE